MCGICGIVGEADEQLIKNMLGRIAHRGPDDEGIYLSETSAGDTVALGHRRLSIIDLSPAGHEPMSDANQQVWLTFNGEIYNFKELRRQLIQLGHRFRSDTDAEVIIYSYLEWGHACLSRFNGMFAFGIWDSRDESLFIARDRFGIKPVYYTETADGFAFASEIKALLPLPRFSRELNLSSLDQFMTFLWVPDPKTIFRHVYKLPPAHYLIYRDGRADITEYWDLAFDVDDRTTESDWIDRLRHQITRSVESQMVADVPLGAFLSGGVDSSTIVALMTGASSQKVTTYSFGFRTEDLRYEIVEDDIKYARIAGREFKTDYHEQFLEPRVMDLLPKLVYQLDEPVADPAIITSYLICRAARERLTVLLSGMGGDEIFAGYPRHLADRLAGIFNLIPGAISGPLVARLPGGKPGRFTAPLRNIKKLAHSAALPQRERYLGYLTYFTELQKREMYSGELREMLDDFDPYSEHNRYLDRVAGQHFVDQMLYLDLKTFLPCLNLTYTDKTSMASSVEVRVPLLDHELVELTARIPSRLKLKRLTRKYIFKQAARRWLPREIIDRKKAGFGAPVRAWLVRELRDTVEDLLSESAVRRRGYFDYRSVRRLIDDNLAGRQDNSLKIFQLLTLELWHQAFIDVAQPATLQSGFG
jgi:asparagine synthase (glutamine-hydrolysing)